MAHDPSLLDRIRIERVVWTLDQRLYDLPRKVRVAHRRDLRDNLTEGARAVGTTSALRDLGDAATLADAYRKAQFGTSPRPTWTTAALFLATTAFILTSVMFDAAKTFGDGILAGNPDAEGTYQWSGIAHIQNDVTYTVTDGEHTFVGGAFSPLTWALLIAGFLIVARAWRALPRRRNPLQGTVAVAP